MINFDGLGLLNKIRAKAAPAKQGIIKKASAKSKAAHGKKPPPDSLIGKVSSELLDEVLKYD